ncbi:polysaccharide deacetylase family protein [candidate division GN15 bacterium]|nr:polysaccharide deacetylase family protein [candidate division GN15 bacterium]
MARKVGVFLLFLSLTLPTAQARDIALSFDDAPSGQTEAFSGPERTKTLIRKLDSLGIEEVVFFCVTERLQWHDGKWRLKAYADAGHLIANHTHSHRHPHELGAAKHIEDIALAHSLLKEFPNFRQWFRFPYLDQGNTIPLRDSIRAGLRDLEYRQGYVTVDTYDWYLNGHFRDSCCNRSIHIDTNALRDIYVQTISDAADFYAALAIEVLQYEPKHVLLLHENDLAALFIDDLVTELRNRGWSIISPTEAYRDRLTTIIPEGLMTNQGRVAAIAADRGYSGELRHFSEDADFLDRLLIDRKVFTRWRSIPRWPGEQSE